MQIVSDYLDNEPLRKSFCRLAMETFGLDFEPWYRRGAFHGMYHPFSIEENGEILSNVSANEFYFCIEGTIKKAVQLGTVMTCREHRGRGLARRLMEYILPLLSRQAEFIFLFANDTVLEFYPKFGFRRIPEVRYISPVPTTGAQRAGAVTAIWEQEKPEILSAVEHRVPASRVFSPVKDLWPMDASLPGSNILRLPDKSFVLWEKKAQTFMIQDIISARPFSVSDVLPYLDFTGCNAIQFHFFPEGISCQRQEIWDDDDALFVLGPDSALPKNFSLPPTSQT